MVRRAIIQATATDDRISVGYDAGEIFGSARSGAILCVSDQIAYGQPPRAGAWLKFPAIRAGQHRGTRSNAWVAWRNSTNSHAVYGLRSSPACN